MLKFQIKQDKVKNELEKFIKLKFLNLWESSAVIKITLNHNWYSILWTGEKSTIMNLIIQI